MARIDKYDPVDGGFRAPLAADRAGSADPVGVGLDTNGRVVEEAGTTGIVGVLCKPSNAKAGDIVDVMTDGEIVEFDGDAGTAYFAAAADGAIDTTDTGTFIGFTVEAGRLIVRAGRVAPA